MTSTTANAPIPSQQGNKTGVGSKPKAAPRRLTLEEFRRKYSNREDGYKYEFVKGEIIKTPSNMNPTQLFIVRNLSRFFAKTSAYVHGLLFPQTQTVHVYTSPISVTICRDQRVCSAAPVVPDFEMTAAEVFAKKL